MNLLMIAPLRDSRGVMRYFIGAQVDVSGLAKECTDLEALQRMLEDKEEGNEEEERKDELQELSEMFNLAELDIVRRYGGRMHREHVEENDDSNSSWQRPRLLLINPSPDGQDRDHDKRQDQPSRVHGKLAGVYQHVSQPQPPRLSPSCSSAAVSPGAPLPVVENIVCFSISACAWHPTITLYGSHRQLGASTRRARRSSSRGSWCDCQNPPGFKV